MPQDALFGGLLCLTMSYIEKGTNVPADWRKAGRQLLPRFFDNCLFGGEGRFQANVCLDHSESVTLPNGASSAHMQLGNPGMKACIMVGTRCRGPHSPSLRRISSSVVLYFEARPTRGSVSITFAGLGCPTRSRALAFTAFVTENSECLRFFMATLSM